MKPSTYKFDDPYFPMKYFICVCDDVQVEHAHYPGLLPLYGNVNGLCSTDGDGGTYIFFARAALTHGIIAHEIVHAVVAVMSYICAPMTRDTNEQMAYVAKFITRKVYAFLKRKGIKVSCL